MSLLTRIQDAFLGLLRPWLFMTLSTSFIPQTVCALWRERVLPTPSRFRAAWFGRFWAFAAPNIKLNVETHVLPLLEGRTSGGRVVDEPTGPGVRGVVLEIGAGGGIWVDLFSERKEGGDGTASGVEAATANQTGAQAVVSQRKPSSSARTSITRVYGIEPNASHHASLRRAVKAAGLEDVYEIVPVGIEDLSRPSSPASPSDWDGRIKKGSVDSIVSILCLCSIPAPEENIRELYRYLKPGGRWYVLEHVRCEYSWYMRLYQRFLNIFWPFFIGGCLLCRPTEKTLRDAGPWAKVDVGQPPTEPWYQCVPHILGVYTK